MLRKLLVLLTLAYAMVPAASGTLYFNVAPSNVTYGETFITFVKIVDSAGKIIIDPASMVSANYSGNARAMQPLNVSRAAFPGTADYWATAQEYLASTSGYVNLTTQYTDTSIGVITANASANITVGNISISFTKSANFNMTKKIGENLTMEAYLQDVSGNAYIPPGAKIQYLVYDFKRMEVISGPTNFVACSYDTTRLCSNYTLNSTSPAGIISLYATNGTHYGGRNIFFAAIPYNINPSVNSTYPGIGDSVEIALNINNIFGSVSGVSAKIIYPDGTKSTLTFSASNGYKQTFAAPNMSGDYVLNATVNHTMYGITNYSVILRLQPAYLDARTDKAAYGRGETVNVTVSVYDSNGTALLANSINATLLIPGGANATYNDTSMYLSGNAMFFNYTLPMNAPVGEYNVSVNASDNRGRTYYKKISFIVNAFNKALVASPASITHIFTSLANATYLINLTSNSTSNITAVQVAANASISPYIVLNTSAIAVPLAPNSTTGINLIITPNASISDSVTGNVMVTFDGNTLAIPLTIRNGLLPSLEIMTRNYSYEILAGKRQRASIGIKNNGSGTMSGINMSADANTSAYIGNITLPGSISAGSSANAYFDIKFPSKGGYSGILTFTAPGAANATVTLSLDILDDFYPAIDDLINLQKTLNTRVLVLEANGKAVSSLSSKATALQGKANDLKSLYDNGRYAEAKLKLIELQGDADEIQTALDAIEGSTTGTNNQPNSTAIGDGICDETEPCSSTDCIGAERCDVGSGKSTGIGTIIIIVIAVVIVAVVLATSIMPDEKKRPPVPI